MGYVFNQDATLAFVTAGIAMSHIKSELYDATGTTVLDQQSDDKTGLTLGLGLEHYFSKNISAKADYRHTDYGTLDVAATNYTGAGAYEHQNVKEDVVRFGLNYHF